MRMFCDSREGGMKVYGFCVENRIGHFRVDISWINLDILWRAQSGEAKKTALSPAGRTDAHTPECENEKKLETMTHSDPRWLDHMGFYSLITIYS